MARLQYNHASDNIAGAALLTATTWGALVKYPVGNIANLDPASPVKFDAVAGELVFDFVSAKAQAVIALIHHNLDAALNVRWQSNAANTWGAPSSDQPFVIAAADAEGYRPNTVLDLSGAPPTYRYGRLKVPANSRNVIIGEIWIGTTLRTVVNNYKDGYQRTDQRQGGAVVSTRGGQDWVSATFGRRRGLTGSITTTAAGLAALNAWNQSCAGKDRPTLVLPFAEDITDALLARWTVDYGYTGERLDNDDVPVGWLELARGTAWP